MNTTKRRTLRPPGSRVFQVLYNIGLGPIVGRLVLLLTTTGRKTGLPRVTAVQYEEIDGAIHVGSSRGTHADWFRNILANPRVRVRVKSRQFTGIAEPVTDPARIADFLEYRLRKHPAMIGRILQADGLPPHPGRAELEQYATQLAMVIIRPDQRQR
ncbi:MAG: nitroreductase family deazaflavin-dependent oxidoreductase [Chloroflexi bacterium]|nr:nitroreductase family deazaflavin-dependent oxidoreductase [Chloroflexota bacterium]